MNMLVCCGACIMKINTCTNLIPWASLVVGERREREREREGKRESNRGEGEGERGRGERERERESDRLERFCLLI